jgi:hypothetical protein
MVDIAFEGKTEMGEGPEDPALWKRFLWMVWSR